MRSAQTKGAITINHGDGGLVDRCMDRSRLLVFLPIVGYKCYQAARHEVDVVVGYLLRVARRLFSAFTDSRGQLINR